MKPRTLAIGVAFLILIAAAAAVLSTSLRMDRSTVGDPGAVVYRDAIGQRGPVVPLEAPTRVQPPANEISTGKVDEPGQFHELVGPYKPPQDSRCPNQKPCGEP